MLHSAKFKAQRGKTPNANGAAPIPDEKMLPMEDAVTKQLHIEALDPAGSRGRFQIVLQKIGTSGGHGTAGVAVEVVDIGALDVVDHKS